MMNLLGHQNINGVDCVISGNRINGMLPEFGNPIHIALVKKLQKIFSAGESIHEIEWEQCRYVGEGFDGVPRTYYDAIRNCDAVVDYIPCPRCNRLHKLVVCYDPQGNWYDELISIDESVREFECWNCGLEFFTDEDRNVYVKPEQEQ